MVTNATIFLNLSSDSAVYNVLPFNNSWQNETSNFDDILDDHPSPYSVAESIVIGTVLSFLIILAIFGNILVCVAVFTDRRLKHLNNLLLVSLAIADLLMASVVMTFAVVNDILDKWLFGPVFCNIWISSDIMCSTASILNLCVISLDRYIHIRDPFKYDEWMNWKKIAAMIISVWILSAAISFIPIHLKWHMNPDERDIPIPAHVCLLDLNPVYSVVSSTISFYIPCIVMLSIYLQLYCYARKHVAEIKRTSQPSHFKSANGKGKGNSSGSSDHKAAVTLGIIVGVFLFCWMPFFVINLMIPLFQDIPIVIFKILTWLGYVNSCLNPIIYSIFNKDFRNAFRRILFSKCKCVQARSRHAGYLNSYGRNTTTTKSSAVNTYILHAAENGNKRDCREPLCSDATAL